MKNNPKYIIIHCSDVSYKDFPNQLDSINNYHRDVKEFPASPTTGLNVGYQTLYCGANRYICRDELEEGAHCNQVVDGKSMNIQSIGACVGFDGDIEDMPPASYALLQEDVRKWQDKYKIPNENVFFHRHFATTKTCPGSRLDDLWLAKLLKRPVSVPSAPCVAESPTPAKLPKWITLFQALVESLVNYYRNHKAHA